MQPFNPEIDLLTRERLKIPGTLEACLLHLWALSQSDDLDAVDDFIGRMLAIIDMFDVVVHGD